MSRKLHINLILAILFAICIGSPLSAWSEKLSLSECLQRARTENPTLRTNAKDLDAVKLEEKLAKSGYFPQVNAQGGYTSQLKPQGMEFEGMNIAEQDPNFASASLDITQTIYDFGRTASRKEQALNHIEAARNSYKASEQDVFLQVVKNYYGIMQNEELLTMAQDEVKQREQHMGVAKTLFEEGVTTRNDLLQAEVNLAGSRQKELSAENNLQNSWLSLNYLTGQPLTYRADLIEEEILPLDTKDTENNLLENRQEILSQRARIRAGEAAVKEASSGFYPEFYVQLGLDYVQNSKVTEQAIMGATVGFKMNIFEGNATIARHRQAVEELYREQERLRDLQDSVKLELETAKNDLTVARERIKVTKTAIEQGEENLRINSDRYKAQVGTATDVIDAQTLLSQARTDYYQALFDYRVAIARIKRALGEL